MHLVAHLDELDYRPLRQVAYLAVPGRHRFEEI